MNTFLSIVRWLFGFICGFVLLLAVLVTIPLSVAGRELFTRESGMAWLNSFTSDESAVEKFIEGTLNGIATSNMIEEPAVKDAVKLAADRNSPMGSSLRKVLTPQSVGQNLLVNADAFYSWLEGKEETLVWTFHFGGTPANQATLVANILKYRYDSLPRCTAAQVKEIGKLQTADISMVPCSVGPLPLRTYEDAAKRMLADPEAKKLLSTGIVSDANATEQDRQRVLGLQKVLGAGITITWIAIVLTVLFMILLFTPQGVNFIATGIIVGGIGLMLWGAGEGVSSISPIVRETLGNEIAKQGLYIIGFSILLSGIGIWQLIAQKRPVVIDGAKKSEQTAEIPKRIQAKAG